MPTRDGFPAQLRLNTSDGQTEVVEHARLVIGKVRSSTYCFYDAAFGKWALAPSVFPTPRNCFMNSSTPAA